MKTAPRYIAVLPEFTKVSLFVADCRLVISMMTDNAKFLAPTPTLVLFKEHVDTLATEEQLARKGGKGAAQKRNVAFKVVRDDCRLLTAYIQSVADALPPAEAEAAIISSGLKVAKKGTRTKPPVAARHGKVAGRVFLDSKAQPRPVSYHWMMSTDQQTWTDIPGSFRTTVQVDGLTPGTRYYFRLRTMTKDGLSNPSEIVSIIAL